MIKGVQKVGNPSMSLLSVGSLSQGNNAVFYHVWSKMIVFVIYNGGIRNKACHMVTIVSEGFVAQTSDIDHKQLGLSLAHPVNRNKRQMLGVY